MTRWATLVAAAAVIVAAPELFAQSISSLSPASAVAGSSPVTVTINGQFLLSLTPTVYWSDPSTETTTTLNIVGTPTQSQIVATIPANLLTQPATAQIYVLQGSGTSNYVNFTVTAAPPTLSSLSPSSTVAGSPALTLTVNGANFRPPSSPQFNSVTWNGAALQTTFVSTSQLTAVVPASLLVSPGTAAVSITAANSPAPLTFTITSSVVLSSLSPNTIAAGSPGFTLTLNGSGFASTSIATWNGSPLSTIFVSSTQLAASIAANLIASAGTALVGVSVPGQTSPQPLSFVITPSLTITSLSPSSTVAGGPAFSLAVNGSGFTSGSNIFWNGLALSTVVGNANLATATVPANLIAQQGTAAITVQNGNLVSNTLTFSITASQAPITITSLSPSSALVGSAAFTLTVTGTGFTPATSLPGTGTIISWNGSPLTTTFVSSTQLTAPVPASFLLSPGVLQVSVSRATPLFLPFTIVAPLTLTVISPTTVVAGTASFVLTANGTGFTSSTAITWNGSPITTNFVSSLQLNATVPASLITVPGTVTVDVTAGASQTTPAALQLTITPGLSLTSLSPASGIAGGPAFTLTVNGSNFTTGTMVIWSGTPLPTTFVSATQLTAAVSSNLIVQQGTASVTANFGSQVSNALTFTIGPPTPVIRTISPATVVSGGPPITLTVNGTGFLTGAVVSLNGAPLTSTFVTGTQVTAAVLANLIAQPGTAQITLANPSGTASNAVALTITQQTPAITSIAPSTVTSGGAAFPLTVTGTNFVAGATVSLNGAGLTTTFVSATQLIGAVPANLIAQPGTAQITASNAGGAASNAVTLTIAPPVPSITSLSPSTVVAGSGAFTLTVNGTNFVSGASVLVATTSLTTTFVSGTQLTAAVPASFIQQAGMSPVTVTNPGSIASNPLPLTVTVPVPTITSISPSSVPAGGPALSVTIIGTGFLTGASVLVNGTGISSTFVSATQLTASIPPNQVMQPGTLQITAANPGGSPSNAVTLTITAPPPPTLTSLSPSSANIGDPAFTLTVAGTTFVPGSIVQWNGAPLGTTFVSNTQLTAIVDAGRLIQPGTANITVVNQIPQGPPLVSNALTFTINAVMPVISSLSPNSASAGGPAFSLTVSGTGFLSLTTIQWNSTALTTHFVNATTLTADVPATLLAQAGTVSVTAVNPGASVSAGVTFTINAPAPPVISSLSQTSATAGSTAFTLTVTGTGFTSGAVVNFGSIALTTTFVSPTQLTAAVPANILLVPAANQVVVKQGTLSSNAVTFTVTLPAPPSLRLTPPATSGPAQQPTIDFGLNAGYPLALSGTVTLTFTSNATIPVDDPSIQFASGGRSLSFTVAPNATTLPALLIQTGTVSGVITMNVTLNAAGVNVTPATGSTATITVAKAAPVIRTVTLVHANGYLEVDINGFSTTRDMTTATFQLNAAPGSSFTSPVITLPVSSLFTSWYQSAAATAFGSQFTYAQPFTVIGDTNSITSVTVTLTNSTGTSSATSH